MVIAFIFIGPLTFVPIEPSVPLLRGIMVLAAVGYAHVMVSTFARAQGAAIRHGFQKDIETYLLISGIKCQRGRIFPQFLISILNAGLWSSSFYLGNFVGPTLGGFMVEAYGFRKSTLLFWIMYLIIATVDVSELVYNVKNKRSQRNSEYEQIQ